MPSLCHHRCLTKPAWNGHHAEHLSRQLVAFVRGDLRGDCDGAVAGLNRSVFKMTPRSWTNFKRVYRKVRCCDASGDDDALRLIPVNVLSTSADLLDVKRMHELGCNSHIIKSNNFEHFTEMMRQIAEFWLNVVLLPTTVQD